MSGDKDRRDYLLLLTDQLLEAWDKWSNNPDLKYITRGFEEAVDNTILLFSEGTIPGDLRRMTQLVLQMQEHWEAWKRRAESNPDKNRHPTSSFWAQLEAIAQLRQELKRPPSKRLEPVAKLRALPGMTDNQICRTYGWFDANGAPELWKIDEEETDPGKHSYKIEGWLPPHERERVKTIKAQSAAIERANEQRTAKIKALTRPPAKESIEDLLRLDDMSGKQLCGMKQIDRDELELYCKEHQLTLPPWDAPAANQLQSVFDPGENKASSLKRPAPKPDVKVEIAAANPDEPASVIRASVEAEEGDTEAPASVLRKQDDEQDDADDQDDIQSDGGAMSVEAQVVLYHKMDLQPEEIAAVAARAKHLLVLENNLGQVFHYVQAAAAGRTKVSFLPPRVLGELHEIEDILKAVNEVQR